MRILWRFERRNNNKTEPWPARDRNRITMGVFWYIYIYIYVKLLLASQLIERATNLAIILKYTQHYGIVWPCMAAAALFCSFKMGWHSGCWSFSGTGSVCQSARGFRDRSWNRFQKRLDVTSVTVLSWTLAPPPLVASHGEFVYYIEKYYCICG